MRQRTSPDRDPRHSPARLLACVAWLRDRTRPLRRVAGFRTVRRRILFLARLMRARSKRASSKATFIGITGSSGKTTATALLSHLLEGRAPVHTQILANTMVTLPKTLSRLGRGVGFVVAELGVDRIGSMPPMAALLKPDVAIVTMVGLEHYSVFRGRDAVAREKGELVRALPEDGLAVLNADDPHVRSMKDLTRARTVTFGWSEGADYRVLRADNGFPEPLEVEIEWRGGRVVLVTPFRGRQFWLSTAAAFAAAVELGLSVEMIAQRLACFPAPWDRFGVLRTGSGPTFLVDTAKAPEEAIAPAIEMLGRARAPYKRVVLGQISDFPGNPRRYYRDAYRVARAVADQVIFVGENRHRAMEPAEDRASGRFLAFASPLEVSAHIRATARPDELILLKGAANLHLERIALDWTDAVRCWKTACGKKESCTMCGLYDLPFEEHRGARRRGRRGTPWWRLVWRRKGQFTAAPSGGLVPGPAAPDGSSHP